MGRQVKEGDEITPGDVLCDVETDKATMVRVCIIRDAIALDTLSCRVSQAPSIVVFHWLCPAQLIYICAEPLELMFMYVHTQCTSRGGGGEGGRAGGWGGGI